VTTSVRGIECVGYFRAGGARANARVLSAATRGQAAARTGGAVPARKAVARGDQESTMGVEGSDP
jgi:hypothetical protein